MKLSPWHWPLSCLLVVSWGDRGEGGSRARCAGTPCPWAPLPAQLAPQRLACAGAGLGPEEGPGASCASDTVSALRGSPAGGLGCLPPQAEFRTGSSQLPWDEGAPREVGAHRLRRSFWGTSHALCGCRGVNSLALPRGGHRGGCGPRDGAEGPGWEAPAGCGLDRGDGKGGGGGATFSAVLWGPGQQEGGWDWRGIRKNFLLLLLLALLSEKGATQRPRALPF